jgi:hypothetical protein
MEQRKFTYRIDNSLIILASWLLTVFITTIGINYIDSNNLIVVTFCFCCLFIIIYILFNILFSYKKRW